MRMIPTGWLVAIAFAASGCSDNQPVYPVRGTVTFAGKPMKGGGSIAFIPKDNRPGKTAGGEIAEDGTYSMTTYKPGDGSMVGDFRVVITQVTEKEPTKTQDGEKAAARALTLDPADRIPTVYSDLQKSTLTATVQAQKEGNVIDFDLKAK